MAEATFAPTAASTLTGTSGDDIITLDSSNNIAGNNVNVGAGSDTVIFDGVLGTGAGAGIFGFAAGGTFTNGGGAGYTVTGFETLQFQNGTITSNASVVPERLLANTINGRITTLGGDASAGAPDFDLSQLIDWNGTAVTTTAGTWTIQSIEGQSADAGANISVVENGVIQGRVAVNATDNGIDVTAENAFHTSIAEIGGTRTMSVDVVLTNGTGATFSETLSVDVVGVASDANNTFAGTTGADIVDGLGGNDSLRGGDGADILFGNDGNDEIFAGAGDTGNDSFAGGDGNDVIGGGAGNDLIIGDSDLAGLIGGSSAAGAVAADDGSDLLFGGDGDDIIWTGNSDGTGTADDVAWAGAGDDTINGAGGNDSLGGGDGDDSVLAGAGDDTVFGGAGNDTLDGQAGDDVIFAGAGNDSVLGGAGADEIFNGAGDDTVDGGADDDIIWGGAGNDSLTGGLGADTFAFVAGNGNDEITDFLQGTDVVDLTGLTGVSSVNDFILVTTAGNTTLFYGDGDSILFSNGITLTDADFLFA